MSNPKQIRIKAQKIVRSKPKEFPDLAANSEAIAKANNGCIVNKLI